jgi:DNA adenine methylase
VMINDANKELICTYIQVRDDIDTVIDILKTYESKYNAQNVTEDDRFMMYMDIRTKFNDNKRNSILNSETAAMFIFLNKTCFNGLYRVNNAGAFNVPKGKITKPIICDEQNLRNASSLLQNVTITSGDYSGCEKYIDDKTFVYLDPPYRELKKNQSFTKYQSDGFTDIDQIDLCEFIKRINAKNALFVMSNSDPKNTDINDNFFDDLYKDFNIDRVSATRRLNRNNNGRGAVNEILIYNLKTKSLTTKKDIPPCEVINFINKFKFIFANELEQVFTRGNCYYFAIILKERFQADIYYLPIKNHFIAKISDKFFDITGLIIPDEIPTLWDDYMEYDPINTAVIIRDCLNFETR